MSAKSLVINVPPGIRKTLSEAGFQICYSFAVGGKFNVVARASVISCKNTISWTEAYSIFGTTQTFNSGDVITDGQSENHDINFGQTYKLKDWNSTSVSADRSLPSGTFGFSDNVQATPVVCMRTVGVDKLPPIFIGDSLPAGSFTTFNRPKAWVAVWFQRDLKKSTMIAFDPIHAHVIDMTSTTKFETTYDDEGQWNDKDSLEVKSVNYFLNTPAYIRPKGKDEED